MEGTKRHPIHAHYKVGFNRDGKLQAMQVRLVLDGGAYKSKTFPVTTRMAIEAAGPYIVPNIDTISTSVYTNNVYSDALRGFGSPQVDFCSESLMDEIAKELNMDPVELRKKYGRALRMWGAVDKREIAAGPANIDAHLRALEPLIADGGFIPTVDHLVPPDVSLENFLYYLKQKEKLLRGESL